MGSVNAWVSLCGNVIFICREAFFFSTGRGTRAARLELCRRKAMTIFPELPQHFFFCLSLCYIPPSLSRYVIFFLALPLYLALSSPPLCLRRCLLALSGCCKLVVMWYMWRIQPVQEHTGVILSLASVEKDEVNGAFENACPCMFTTSKCVSYLLSLSLLLLVVSGVVPPQLSVWMVVLNPGRAQISLLKSFFFYYFVRCKAPMVSRHVFIWQDVFITNIGGLWWPIEVSGKMFTHWCRPAHMQINLHQEAE